MKILIGLIAVSLSAVCANAQTMSYPLGATVDVPDFYVTSPSSGSQIAADYPPYCAVRRNATSAPIGISGIATAIAGVTTGGYRFEFAATTANGFAINDNVNVSCGAVAEGLYGNVNYHFRILPTDNRTLEKNVTGQQLGIWFKTAAGANATGISTANITCTISKDFGAPATTNDTTEAEVGNGVYYIDLTQAETNANWIAVNCHDASGVGLDYSSLITTQH